MAPVTAAAHGTGSLPASQANAHGGYTVMMSEEDYHNTQSMEMTKFVREHFKTPKVPSYRAERIRCRTDTMRIEERDRGVWRENNLRRHHHLTCGFYTPCHKPYHPIGDVELNSQRLLLDSLSDFLPKKLPMQSLTSRFGRRDPKLSPLKVEPAKTIAEAPLTKERVKDADVDEKLRERAYATAGYAYIQQRLSESETILRAERGGQTFEKCMKKIKDMKKRQSEMGRRHPSLTLNPPAFGAWSPMNSPSSTPAPKIEDIEDAERRAHNRKRHLWLGKAQCVMKLLNALHNIKSRDLRSRVPMSHEQVKHLYRDVIWEKPAISQSKPTKTPLTTLDTTARVGSSADTVSSGDQPMVGTLKPSKPVLPANKSSMSMQGKPPGDVQSPSPAPWKKFGYHGNARKGFRLEREHRVETWEDLLTASSPSPQKRNSVLPNLLSASHPVYAVMKWHQVHSDNKQKQPYWMTVGVANEEKVKRVPPPNVSGSKRSVTDDQDAEATLQDIQQNFKKVQKNLAREVQQDLERLDRDRQRVIKQKFQVITQSRLFERTVLNLKAARAHQAGPVMAIDEDSEIKLSPWFMDLKSDIETALGKYDPDVVAILNRLSQFSLEDGKSIANAKEKLCLLVMSMPASDLLTIPMQLAIVFVLEEILWAPPKALVQWLHHKKVPVVIDIDQQSTS
ncbi:uncharacterized protein [Diadema setosum]|uniref:uncharacterized protein isoform X1 n=1 Tax=Diadema setosum TaxID=31175 RepID=UPI003B3ABBCA